jgi:hypothetical protein
MSYRPYPNRDRALRQLARTERPTRRTWVTPTGAIAEEYEFPGQSLAILTTMIAQAKAGVSATRRNVWSTTTVGA